MQRRGRFEDPRLQIVWAAIETLEAGLQYVLLQELATDFALAVGNPRTGPAKVRAGVSALREVAEILGHPPSVGEYRACRRQPNSRNDTHGYGKPSRFLSDRAEALCEVVNLRSTPEAGLIAASTTLEAVTVDLADLWR